MLGIPAEQLLKLDRIGLADSALAAPQASFGGVEFYPDFEAKASVLCSRLARNHPLPDGNKRAAYLALREFVARNGRAWKPASVDETVTVIEKVAAGDMSEGELADWIAERAGSSV